MYRRNKNINQNEDKNQFKIQNKITLIEKKMENYVLK